MAEIYIHKNCALSPTTKEELMAYIFYVESKLQMSVNGVEICTNDEWEGTDEQISIVENHRLWGDFLNVWEYAEQGILHIKCSPTAEMANDLFIDLYKFVGMGQVMLAHDGSFGYESLSVRHAGAKVLYKYLARLKLDYKVDLDFDFAMIHLFPLAHDKELNTIEYALLAGLSHVGAVRNEISNKNNPLIAQKVGNNLVILIEEARKRLPSKRKFVPSEGVEYD